MSVGVNVLIQSMCIVGQQITFTPMGPGTDGEPEHSSSQGVAEVSCWSSSMAGDMPVGLGGGTQVEAGGRFQNGHGHMRVGQTRMPVHHTPPVRVIIAS